LTSEGVGPRKRAAPVSADWLNEGMIKLNGSAGEILKRCDGVRTINEITLDLESAFNATALGADVEAFIRLALEKKWLEIR
jgi:pyrroloquinoline quinone biosynthesis protein D